MSLAVLHNFNDFEVYMSEGTQLVVKSSRLTTDDFDCLSQMIYDRVGIQLVPAKKTMLEARLQKRLRHLQLESFQDYCTLLKTSKQKETEMVQMIDLVTTNKTDFFREPDHFDYLVNTVLPEWLKNSFSGSRKLLIWSAGCSSGEEPYTLAMVLQDYAKQNQGFDFQIIASDISTKVLEKALMAIYEEEKVIPVPERMKRNYLLKSKDRQKPVVRIVSELRQKVRFRRINFMDSDYGIKEKADIIFCRNVIIYFDRQTQEEVLNRFYRQLAPGGYIFMGHSETLNGLDVPFVMVAPTIYRKKG